MERLRAKGRWEGWCNLRLLGPLVPVAGAIVCVESVAAWTGVEWHPAGGVAVTPVLPAAILFASLVGWRRLGLSKGQIHAWSGCTAGIALMLVVVSVVFLTRVGPPRALLSFFASATEEEVVFRLAAPVAVGGLAAFVLGRSPGDLVDWGTGPRIVALAVAALGFSLGPGHIAQVGTAPWRLLPFLAIGVLLSYVVLRTGNLVVGLLVHIVLNLATVCYLSGGITRDAWAFVVIFALAGFGLGAERAGRRLGLVSIAAA